VTDNCRHIYWQEDRSKTSRNIHWVKDLAVTICDRFIRFTRDNRCWWYSFLLLLYAQFPLLVPMLFNLFITLYLIYCNQKVKLYEPLQVVNLLFANHWSELQCIIMSLWRLLEIYVMCLTLIVFFFLTHKIVLERTKMCTPIRLLI